MNTKFRLVLAALSGVTLGAVAIAGVRAQENVSTHAYNLPMANRAEDVGISSARLSRVTSTFQAEVDKAAIPGAVVLIARRGKVAYFEAFGFRDREKQAPMQKDSIFRIASLTKPFTSVAVMMLAEEGKLALHDPVSQYLPEFKNGKVGVEKLDGTATPHLALEPVRREITIQDLLRHTSGLTRPSTFSLVTQAYVDAKVADRKQTSAEMIAKLAKLPLAFQPGTTWEYSMSTDVLGRVIEVVSGVDLDRFIAERIAKPLGLSDSGFWVPQESAARLAEPQVDKRTGKRPPMVEATQRPGWFSGAGGMVSTAADYYRFSQMLLNGGQLDGVRLLSPKTVALMTSNHLPPGVTYGPTMAAAFEALAPMPEFGTGFGLGFAVRTNQGRSPVPGSVGDYYWGGATGTYFWVDPQEQLIAVMMLQVANDQRIHYRYLMRELVYQATID
jgi:CubicO group peptidase (beta-lactamase class C family)